MKKRNILLLLLLWPLFSAGQGTVRLPLNGVWTFALDPLNTGVPDKWYTPDFPSAGFDKVTVPHSFSVDKRYFFYTGTAWYFKKFNAPVVQKDNRTFLHFDAVFYKTSIWLNGQLAGEHEGGYTPFEIEVTHLLKEKNTLAVSVSNAWDTTTIPGAKASDASESPAMAQLYPWMNYGGITRPVQLLTRPAAFIQNVKVTAEPDLKKRNARIAVTVFLENFQASDAAVKVSISRQGQPGNIRFRQLSANAGQVVLEGTMPDARYWNQDAPNLYEAEITAGNDTMRKTFGIRKLEIKGTQLLLNGEPVRMGGCNRPLDYPGYGSLDPEEVLEKDLTLIKSGSMELSRISHYPVSESMLIWADKHGLLIIAEAGNWQMTPRQMADPLMRKKYRSQLTEMIKRDWNHPCIVAYSVGNEFQSQTPEGIAWVKDMGAFVKSLDATRLITFASFNVWRDYVKHPEDEASQYVDFISTNIYGNGQLAHLQHIHEVYPNKPVYISEFGMRLPADGQEEERIRYFRKAVEVFRQCDYLIGASVWTFNDYMSRYPGTDANGYRAWGLIAPDRSIRPVYAVWQEEFAPAVIELLKIKDGNAIVKVAARLDFPSYTLRRYRLSYGGQSTELRTLKPGESQELTIPVTGNTLTVSLVKPGGFTVVTKTFDALR
ncbi:glycoside hydrolase family 2 protein [Chitinophaga sp. 22321]|uniref:Beta galactosidase jelly roll domain-containing protein n=1 Tax=Chitinophaga hostae TaxID=2831022 RepID=A0ABS5J5A8_9BACT|nr:glycoside hydrolase family 2 TIM barrel-domain containing protein [Chitinophaga hostae]MBS0030399.1 beta galactosidase jelly roll domain-containing protein [Chitinophaga hostae]